MSHIEEVTGLTFGEDVAIPVLDKESKFFLVELTDVGEETEEGVRAEMRVTTRNIDNELLREIVFTLAQGLFS